MAAEQSNSGGWNASHSPDYAQIDQSVGREGEEVTSKAVEGLISASPLYQTDSDVTVHRSAVPGAHTQVLMKPKSNLVAV